MDLEFRKVPEFIEVCKKLDLDPITIANRTEFEWKLHSSSNSALAKGVREAWGDSLRQELKGQTARKSGATTGSANMNGNALAPFLGGTDARTIGAATRVADEVHAGEDGTPLAVEAGEVQPASELVGVNPISNHGATDEASPEGSSVYRAINSPTAAASGDSDVEFYEHSDAPQPASGLCQPASASVILLPVGNAASSMADGVLDGECLAPESDDELLLRANIELKGALGRVHRETFAIGSLLAEVKARVGHGRFLKWVKSECYITPRQVQLYLSIWNTLGPQCEIVSHLGMATLAKLSAKSTSDVLKTEILKELTDGPGTLRDRDLKARLVGARARPAEGAETNSSLEQDPEGQSGQEVANSAFRLIANALSLDDCRDLARLLTKFDVRVLIRLLDGASDETA